MKILAALFAVLFVVGSLSLWSVPGGPGDSGLARLAFGVGLMTIAVLGWGSQLLIVGIDGLLRRLRRKQNRRP